MGRAHSQSVHVDHGHPRLQRVQDGLAPPHRDQLARAGQQRDLRGGPDDGGPLVSDLDVGQYFRPQVGGTLLVGGTEPACDELEWIDDPDQYNENTTVEHFETTVYRLARRVPDFGVPHRPVGLAALYDASDDWVPIYDKSSLPGWFMACGTSGNQFKNAPIAGQFMRALVDAADAGIDHDVDPVSFTGALTGQPIHLSSFSRRRDRASTSGTVMG